MLFCDSAPIWHYASAAGVIDSSRLRLGTLRMGLIQVSQVRANSYDWTAGVVDAYVQIRCELTIADARRHRHSNDGLVRHVLEKAPKISNSQLTWAWFVHPHSLRCAVRSFSPPNSLSTSSAPQSNSSPVREHAV